MASRAGMAKQSVAEDGTILVPPPKAATGNKDHYQRLNYLYQLSMFTTLNDKQPLARTYAKNLDLVSKKTKCSLLPQVKRTICKKCHSILIPNKTASTKIRNKARRKDPKNDDLVIRCVCGEEKVFRIGLNRDYRSFAERGGNIIDV
ncbi:ribonuclease P protein subunit RPR2 KNAG_0K01720 [Huiozyma naganishii CBS 8797]|uniref:Uncharacterized protein n=1 Tax=Huiozyma naganishii (strain ATCC MYA-139 / BCRC 22969 / CBS 8797 / KCTC 17520 / NBRC 10181 / NCYC 3082 / Yp74L-3) TaxID=1071383 RepID=J7S3D4_HUIN7|nr:hypothetical protein KNAG_0K01720 [Kazachstania naganishii CBS 8797]CCK72537.1 hypothetical protein KNAG_0K01720 [Kazachstania naganishii CBS 8797]